MSATLDDLYLEWLYSQVGSVKLKNKQRTYWSLMRQLYTKEFVWLIPNDDNRVENGRELRYEFLEDAGLDMRDVDPYWLGLGCSVLEMMIDLSRRASFLDDREPVAWFWEMIENLHLHFINDATYEEPHISREIQEIVDTVIWRTYNPDGRGGLFPLRHPHEDQRDVEIWYQLNSYILERS